MIPRRRSAALGLAATLLLSACGGGGGEVTVTTAAPAAGSGFGGALNAERASAGRAAIGADGRLAQAAQAHADDMARQGYFSHTGRDGSGVDDRVSSRGYRFCFVAENIADGQRTEAEVMNSWMNSTAHRQNILAAEAEAFGLGRSGEKWVLVLGSEC